MAIKIIPIAPPNGQSNPLNPLSKQTRRYLGSELKIAISDPKVSSIILFGGQNFSAGADIS